MPVPTRSQMKAMMPPERPVALLLVENSEAMSNIWIELRHHYLTPLVSELQFSNEMSTASMPTILLESMSTEYVCHPGILPRRFSSFSDAIGSVRFNRSPNNTITTGLISHSIDILSSARSPEQPSLLHLVIVAANPVSPGTGTWTQQGLRSSQSPWWERQAQRLKEAGIRCHLVCRPNQDMAGLASLFNTAVKMQNYREETLSSLRRSAESSTGKVVVRLAVAKPVGGRNLEEACRTTNGADRFGSPNSNSIHRGNGSANPGDPSRRPPHRPPSKTDTHVPNPSTNQANLSLVARLQQVHGLTKKKLYGSANHTPPRTPFFKDERVDDLTQRASPQPLLPPEVEAYIDYNYPLSNRGGKAPTRSREERKSRITQRNPTNSPRGSKKERGSPRVPASTNHRTDGPLHTTSLPFPSPNVVSSPPSSLPTPASTSPCRSPCFSPAGSNATGESTQEDQSEPWYSLPDSSYPSAPALSPHQQYSRSPSVRDTPLPPGAVENSHLPPRAHHQSDPSNLYEPLTFVSAANATVTTETSQLLSGIRAEGTNAYDHTNGLGLGRQGSAAGHFPATPIAARSWFGEPVLYCPAAAGGAVQPPENIEQNFEEPDFNALSQTKSMGESGAAPATHVTVTTTSQGFQPLGHTAVELGSQNVGSVLPQRYPDPTDDFGGERICNYAGALIAPILDTGEFRYYPADPGDGVASASSPQPYTLGPTNTTTSTSTSTSTAASVDAPQSSYYVPPESLTSTPPGPFVPLDQSPTSVDTGMMSPYQFHHQSSSLSAMINPTVTYWASEGSFANLSWAN